jgi:hypothetical protein
VRIIASGMQLFSSNPEHDPLGRTPSGSRPGSIGDWLPICSPLGRQIVGLASGAFSLEIFCCASTTCWFEAGIGAFLHIPQGTLHTYKNIGAAPARLLVILTPGGCENFWREIGDPAQQDSVPPAPPVGIVERLLAVAPKYHLEIPPPPK